MSSQIAQQICETDGPLGDLFAETQGEECSDVTMLTEEHRKRRRRKLSSPVWIRLASDDSVGPAQARQLVDISPTGLGMLSKSSLRPGQSMMVELCLNTAIWSGPMKVVHCSEMAGGHQVGMTVADTPLPGTWPMADKRPGRRPSTTANLSQFQAEIPKAMRAYRRARMWRGLLGTSLQNSVRQTLAILPTVDSSYNGDCQRRHRRLKMNGEVHLVVPTYYRGKWLRAQIRDISEGGAGLLPFGMTVDHAEVELAGEFRISPNMPVVVGIDSEPNTLWLPAEISHVSSPKDGAMHIGVQFNTPKSQKAFGA